MLKIKRVEPGSIGAEIGLNSGDWVLELNGQKARDILDYYYYVAGEEVTLRAKTASGHLVDYDIEKDYDEDLGLEFEILARQCRNKCVFCFIDQQPARLRKTLYIKDDDYRLSFLHGNYISLTNLSRQDIQRIVQDKLSPLYISVHATDPVVRGRLLGRPQGPIVMELLEEFSRAGISFHGQVVLCPGYNDGAILEQTLKDLATLQDALLSLAVVPVGLTKHRDNLTPLRPVDSQVAAEVIEIIHEYQNIFLQSLQRRVVYAADEFFITAGQSVPATEYYEDFAQLENGIGLIRRTLTQVGALRQMPAMVGKPHRVLIVTGCAAAPTLQTVAAELMRVFPDSSVDVLAVENKFLGAQITVAGLLAGADILEAVQGAGEYDLLLIPEVSVRAGCFLDDYRVDDLAQSLDKTVQVAADVLDIVNILRNEVLL